MSKSIKTAPLGAVGLSYTAPQGASRAPEALGKRVNKCPSPRRDERYSEKSMTGIINAGGKGTRLHPITLEIPKPLLTVGRRPIVQHLVDLFREHGVTHIYVTVHADDFSLFK